jgi:hypothetical protein
MSRELKIAIVVGVITLLLWAGSGVLLYCLPDRGTFGDMFGAVNALFSGLAFVGVIYAILLQGRDLDAQQKALLESQQEMQRSVQAQERAADAMRLQAEATGQAYRLQALMAALQAAESRLGATAMTEKGNSQERIRLIRQRDQLEKRVNELIDTVSTQSTKEGH